MCVNEPGSFFHMPMKETSNGQYQYLFPINKARYRVECDMTTITKHSNDFILQTLCDCPRVGIAYFCKREDVGGKRRELKFTTIVTHKITLIHDFECQGCHGYRLGSDFFGTGRGSLLSYHTSSNPLSNDSQLQKRKFSQGHFANGTPTYSKVRKGHGKHPLGNREGLVTMLAIHRHQLLSTGDR